MSSQPPAGTSAPGAPVGPVERRHFFEEQRRHRRVASFLSVLVAVATILMGIPLSTLLFPFLFALAAITLDLLSIVLPVPDLWGAFIGTGGAFAEGENAVWEALAIALIVCLPGVTVMLGLWSYIGKHFIATALEGLAARAGARRPVLDDMEERQLQNVVEEMAIAAGIQPPRVLLADDAALNAAALGDSPDRSTILVTRGVLDRCDRDETQAIAGHLVAMIANGDTRAISRLIAAFAALGFIRKVVQVPLDAGIRGRVLALVAYVRDRNGKPDRKREGELLEWLLEEDTLDSIPPGFRSIALLPFFMTYAFFNMVALLTAWLFLSPVLVPLLRSRRFLGDATAIELNRYPDALRNALGKLSGQGTFGLPITGVTDLLFVVKPGSPQGRKESFPAFIPDLHPALAKRHKRADEIARRKDIRTIGQRVRANSGALGLGAVLLLVLGPLAATAAVLMLFLVVALTGLGLIVGMIYVGFVIAIVNAVLR